MPATRLCCLPTDALPPPPAAVVISGDDSYGKKQVISLTPQIYEYLLSNTREPPILRELREETSKKRGSQMQVSPEQAQLLAMLVRIIGAERCIEVGVYTGYSSLAIALALPESGCLVACEIDAKCLETAKKYYELAGVSQKVDIRLGPAINTLSSLVQSDNTSSLRLEGRLVVMIASWNNTKTKDKFGNQVIFHGTSYDFAFVDADKRMYDEYFELLLQLVRPGGLILFDNVLWHGKVANPQVNDRTTTSIRNFNRKIFEDKRISISMVPIGDGMTICCKRADL